MGLDLMIINAKFVALDEGVITIHHLLNIKNHGNIRRFGMRYI